MNILQHENNFEVISAAEIIWKLYQYFVSYVTTVSGYM